MWWTSFPLVAAFLMFQHHPPAATSCPARNGREPLTTVTLFDGPPEERADLIPDESRGSGDHAYARWDVKYIYEAGRVLFLQCQYSGNNASQVLVIPVKSKVRSCVFRTHPKGLPAELVCQP